jgi:hypothetical protein
VGENTNKVTDDLAKGKKVTYKRFLAAYAWATNKEKARMRELHGGYADRAENDK